MKTIPWAYHGPHILTKPNGEFDGKGWQVNRKISPERSALEYVMDVNLVKFFKSEKQAAACCAGLNR